MKPPLDTGKACVVPQTDFAVHGLTVSLALFTSNAALDKIFRIVQACAAVAELYHQSLFFNCLGSLKQENSELSC